MSKDGDGFRLVGSGAPAEGSVRRKETAQHSQRELRRDLLSLDYSSMSYLCFLCLLKKATRRLSFVTEVEQSDYFKEGDIGFKKTKKKPKKSSKSSSRRVAVDDDGYGEDATAANGGETMIDQDAKSPQLPTAERRLAREGDRALGGFMDDDDLQAALARQRRAMGRKRVQAFAGEEMARQIVDDQRAGSMALDSPVPVGDADGPPLPIKQEEDADVDDDQGGLVMDDTSEFIRNISNRPIAAKREQLRHKGRANTNGRPHVKSESRDDDISLDEMVTGVQEDDEVEEGEAFSEEEEEDVAEMTIDEDIKPDIAKSTDGESASHAFGSTADEKLVSGGLASTLAVLRQSGLVKPLTADELEKERAYKEKERFIAEARLRDAQREMERLRSKASGASKDQAQREYDNKRLQFEHAQKTLEAFKNYKPNVDITYQDEFGRTLTPKEAWKDLSHKFHGKGSGTGKRAKLLKKIAEEKKREAMASGDTPLSVNAAFQARQERMGSATMVLGVGNKK